MSYLRIIRPINLFVIICTQSLLFFIIIEPSTSEYFENFNINTFVFYQLVLCTVLLAAGSYIVNDIYDIDIDKINKNSTRIVNKSMTSKQAWNYFLIISILGLFLACYIAFQVQKIHLLWIFPTAMFGLYNYARRWKRQLYIGNIIVASFSSFVAGVILLFVYDALILLKMHDWKNYNDIILLMTFYMVFAFLSSIYREVIKDIQDMEGDLTYGVRSLPIIFGIATTKKIAHIISSLLILSLIFWLFIWTEIHLWAILFLVLAVIFPLLFLSFQLNKAKNLMDYAQLSKHIKLVMLLGILYLFLL